MRRRTEEEDGHQGKDEGNGVHEREGISVEAEEAFERMRHNCAARYIENMPGLRVGAFDID